MYNTLHRKMITFPKVKTVKTSKLQPGELIHIDFDFYNVTPIFGFNSMLTFVCANIRMLLVLPTASKWSPFHIIYFIFKKLNNEQYSWKRVRFDEEGALETSTYVTNLIVDKTKKFKETTGGAVYRVALILLEIDP